MLVPKTQNQTNKRNWKTRKNHTNNNNKGLTSLKSPKNTNSNYQCSLKPSDPVTATCTTSLFNYSSNGNTWPRFSYLYILLLLFILPEPNRARISRPDPISCSPTRRGSGRCRSLREQSRRSFRSGWRWGQC